MKECNDKLRDERAKEGMNEQKKEWMTNCQDVMIKRRDGICNWMNAIGNWRNTKAI
jgi:hypothetical protein